MRFPTSASGIREATKRSRGATESRAVRCPATAREGHSSNVAARVLLSLVAMLWGAVIEEVGLLWGIFVEEVDGGLGRIVWNHDRVGVAKLEVA